MSVTWRWQARCPSHSPRSGGIFFRKEGSLRRMDIAARSMQKRRGLVPANEARMLCGGGVPSHRREGACFYRASKGFQQTKAARTKKAIPRRGVEAKLEGTP